MDLQRLDLNLLLVLDALFEEPTLTRAAVRLQVSQPTVSTGLARLREALGDELFVRSRTGLAPTPLAARLREPLAAALQIIRLDILARGEFDPAVSRDVFTLCLSDIGELEFLPGLMSRFQVLAPRTRLRAVVMNPDSLMRALEDGEVDLAIGYFPDLTTSMFKQQVLFSHGLSCLTRRDHSSFASGMTLEAYTAATHIAVHQQTRHYDAIERSLERHDIRRTISLIVSHYVNVPALVAQSNLVATLAEPLARRFAELYPVDVAALPFEAPRLEIKQVWHRRFDNAPRLIWLRQLIASVSQNKPHL